MNTRVNIAGVEFKNPVTTASGTFASGKEFNELFDISILGAVTTKGVSDKPWQGNATPRVAETYGGMLNSIGLQNPGAEAFIKDDLKFLADVDTRVIINICGHSIPEYCKCLEMLTERSEIDMFELNISCPNVTEGGMAFGTNWKMVEKVVLETKRVATKPLIVKLSPNVTDIDVIAKAAEYAGADALSMINTLMGMRIDINTRKPILANKIGGLSGPAIHPVAVRMVYSVAQCVKIPIIGMGGIASVNDALEMIFAGATMVAVGSASFGNPLLAVEIIKGIEDYLESNGISDINDLIGTAWK